MAKIDVAHVWFDSWDLKPGEGMRIAVIDNGFNLYHRAFQHLTEENRIIDQWDYVQNHGQALTSQKGLGSHGAQILAVIAGKLTGSYIGIAPFADFLLYRAENDATETTVEEDYVAAAIMRAVERGAHIINISLGYRYDFNETQMSHPYSYFDGKTGPASFAALSAARRNVIVVASMGNEDLNHPGEPNLASPADADSILAVGAMQNAAERWPLSSRGPTYDGRIKPDISAPGSQVPVPNPSSRTELTTESGTSLATPIVAAIAALAWQSQPLFCAQTIRTAILKSGHLAHSPNNEIGHGLVDAERVLFSLMDMPGRPCKSLKIQDKTTKSPLTPPLWLPEPWQRVFNLKGQTIRTDAFIPVINISAGKIRRIGDR
jgi:subtilisin family serine protease